MNVAVDIIMTVGTVILFVILWPLIKWFALILLVGTVIFGLKVARDSRELKKQIEKDPEAYFASQQKEKE
ncbi:MAG: hypothetical protein IKX74_01155 [Erysipelotrichaceae bacterium]|nr:hypothetical protein [Erysipelotrichaceae bacterium]MBO4538393.1 hypothetical protein [Erysipelotrichaceae bacterium]MBR5048250.1 hypothetical protein [Erysipelotrichaceae bacterium]